MGRGSYSCVYKVENVNTGKIYCAKNYYPQVDMVDKSKEYLELSDHCRRELTSKGIEYD